MGCTQENSGGNEEKRKKMGGQKRPLASHSVDAIARRDLLR